MNGRDASPQLLGPDGAPLDKNPVLPPARAEVKWDQQPPTEPPTPVPLDVPPGFEEFAKEWMEIAYREGLLFDVCLDRAIKIVERNFHAGLVGIDHFGDQGVGVGGRLAIVTSAIPIAIKLHEHTLAAIRELETPCEQPKHSPA